MQQIMFIKEVLPMEQIQVTNRQGQPDVLKLQTYVLSDGINTIAGEAVGNFAEAAQQLKLKVGGWVQVSLEFSVNDRKTQDGPRLQGTAGKNYQHFAPLGT